MKKTIPPRLVWAGFLFIIVFAACGSPPPVQTVSEGEILRQLMDTVPRGGGLVFLGVAGRRSKMEDSVQLALEEAARRVALFHNVEGTYSAWSNTGSYLLDYRAESNSSLNYDPDYLGYIEDLEFDEESDVFANENAVFVRVRFPGSLKLNYQPSPSAPDGKPAWVDNPPSVIGDYSAGVGYAGRRNAHRDTVIASYENAAFAIIRSLYTVSWGRDVDYRGEGSLDISYTNSQRLEAKGALREFYALETWTDPADKSVWTLAVAKSAR